MTPSFASAAAPSAAAAASAAAFAATATATAFATLLLGCYCHCCCYSAFATLLLLMVRLPQGERPLHQDFVLPVCDGLVDGVVPIPSLTLAMRHNCILLLASCIQLPLLTATLHIQPDDPAELLAHVCPNVTTLTIHALVPLPDKPLVTCGRTRLA